MTSQKVLTHYNAELPLCLACDASPYMVGAVLSHVMPDGEEKSIAYTSRTLRKALHPDREGGLGDSLWCLQVSPVPYGNKFTLLTDHRSLTTILSPLRSIPSMAAAWMQRWALLLSAHGYTIKYRKGELHANADGLPRLPLPHSHEMKDDTVDIYYTSQFETLPISSTEIRHDTMSDSTLSRVLEMITTGHFPTAKYAGDELSSFLICRHDLMIQHGCLM